MPDVIVVGAGISGLTVGAILRRSGCDVLILERAPRLGGLIESQVSDEFLVEYGPHSTLASPAVLELIRSVELNGEVVKARKRFLWRRRDQQLLEFPTSFSEFVRSSFLSAEGKLRLLAEPFCKPGTAEDESVRSLLARRLGAEVAQVASAAISGIWAGDIDQLSARSALPRLWRAEREHGSLLRGLWASRRERGKGAHSILSFPGGLATLIERLAQRAGEVRLGAEVTHLRLRDGHVLLTLRSGEQVQAPRVVLTTPANSTATLISEVDPPLAVALRDIPYATVGVLTVAFPKSACAHPLDGFGFLAEPVPGKGLLGAIFSSTLFPDRAPPELHLISCFAGGAVNPNLADVNIESVRDNLLAELRLALGISAPGSIIALRYHPRAFPNYPLGHFELLTRLDAFEHRHPQLRFLANWRDGISIADRVAKASDLATSLFKGDAHISNPL